MTEKDIVDFEDKDKFFIDKESGRYVEKETGEEISCKICYTHVKAYDYFRSKSHYEETIPNPLCPNCKEQMYLKADNVVVGEVNYPDPKNKIYYTNIYRCEECNKEICLLPNDVKYNANHDIYYTGGRDYLSNDNKLKPLLEDITKKINVQVTDYVTRKLAGDDTLSEWNIQHWCTGEIEKAICNFLYEAGVKK
jgi:hypothetical protein